MARASTSTRQRKPTRSQPTRAEPGEDEDDFEDEDVDMEPDGKGSSENDLNKKAKDLARLALFSENRRMPLRKDEINKKVLGSQVRSFKAVFWAAQKILQTSFGVEMVELRTRAELDKATDNPDDELDEARNAAVVRKRATAVGTKTYILRSVLDPAIIEYAALTHETILEDEAADASDDDNDHFRTYGSIISWSQADQLGPVGLLYVILTLILVSGRTMSDGELRANLKRLRLPPPAVIPFNERSTHKAPTIEAYLTQLIRQGYLNRQRVGAQKNKVAAKKRGREAAVTQRDGGEDSGSWEWRWGNRAESEVGEVNIAKFAAEFMIERGADDVGEEEEEGPSTSKKKKKGKGKDDEGGARAERRMAAMMKAIERVAGGDLAEPH